MSQKQTSEPKKVIDTDLEFNHIQYVKNAFAFVLATAFANECTPERFRYNFKDEDKRNISIYRAFPKRVTLLPMITIEAAAGDASFTTLGEETGYEIKDVDGADPNLVLGKVFRGTLKLRVNIIIWAETTTDRDCVTDTVSKYMRTLFFGVFLRHKVPFLEITPSELPPEVRDRKRLHKGQVTTWVQTETTQFVDQSLLDEFAIMNLTEVKFGSSDADLQNNNTV